MSGTNDSVKFELVLTSAVDACLLKRNSVKKIAEDLGISVGRCYSMLHNVLNVRPSCHPKMLSADEKGKRKADTNGHSS